MCGIVYAMKILLVDNGTTLLSKLKQLIPGEETVERFDTFKHADALAYDLIILSGGSLFPVYGNEDKFNEEYECIKNAQVPIVGICLGFELIVTAFGGSLKKLHTQDKGIKEIQIVDPSVSNAQTISVYEHHEWGGDMLPDVLKVLAYSTQGPEIIKHQTLPVYGMQFHPEHFVDTLAGDEVFFNIIRQFV